MDFVLLRLRANLAGWRGRCVKSRRTGAGLGGPIEVIAGVKAAWFDPARPAMARESWR